MILFRVEHFPLFYRVIFLTAPHPSTLKTFLALVAIFLTSLTQEVKKNHPVNVYLAILAGVVSASTRRGDWVLVLNLHNSFRSDISQI